MSKSVIDEIEGELSEFTARPWTASVPHDLNRQTDVYNVHGLHFAAFNKAFDAQFFTKSPERLAALCRYVRATEALIEAWGPLNLAAMSAELQSARKELGLGKE